MPSCEHCLSSAKRFRPKVENVHHLVWRSAAKVEAADTMKRHIYGNVSVHRAGLITSCKLGTSRGQGPSSAAILSMHRKSGGDDEAYTSNGTKV